MKDFIEYIVKNLVDQPDDVAIQCFEGERGMIVEIKVGQPDIGKVIGSRGNTIKALRTISTMVGARLGKKIRVELIE
jgi:uncharacterized protein